jgi:hypothetical protein
MRYKEEAFKARAAGATLEEVAATVRRETGRGYTKQAVTKLLSNPKHVAKELFDAAQDPPLRYRPRKGSRASAELLAGLVYCAGCGKRATVGGRHQYACPGRGCPAPATVLVDRLNEYVSGAVVFRAMNWEEILGHEGEFTAHEISELTHMGPRMSVEKVEKLRRRLPDLVFAHLDGRVYWYPRDSGEQQLQAIREWVGRVTIRRGPAPLGRRVKIEWAPDRPSRERHRSFEAE